MSRNPLIEAIHAARYDLETCAVRDRAAFRRRLDNLVAQAITQSKLKVAPRQVLDILYDDYKKFRRMKRAQAPAVAPRRTPRAAQPGVLPDSLGRSKAWCEFRRARQEPEESQESDRWRIDMASRVSACFRVWVAFNILISAFCFLLLEVCFQLFSFCLLLSAFCFEQG